MGLLRPNKALCLKRRILNYLERITLFDLTHMMSMTDLVAISVETSRIYIRCSWRKSLLN